MNRVVRIMYLLLSCAFSLAAAASTTTLTVPATTLGGRGLNSGILGPTVALGDNIRVTATGLISATESAPCDSGPNGYASPPYGACTDSHFDNLASGSFVGAPHMYCQVPCAPIGALIFGYVSGSSAPWWVAGEERLFIAPRDGQLAVAVNDWWLADNQCAFTVVIDVNEPLAPGEVPEILDLSCPCPPCGVNEWDGVPEIADATEEILALLQDETRFTDDVELQVAVDTLTARFDALEARLDDMDARQCEIIRLLLTPQGRRESDACGALTSFPNGKRSP